MSHQEELFPEDQYYPKWGSKNVSKKLDSILEFAFKHFSIYTRQTIGFEEITEFFGHNGRSKTDPNKNALNRYMRELLLTKTRLEIPQEKCAEYKFSWANLFWAFDQQGKIIPEKAREISLVGQKLLKDVPFSENKKAKDYFDLVDLESNYTDLLTKNAEYKEQNFTTRYEAKFQTKTKVARSKFWCGWYDYDMEACSYSTTYQKFSWIHPDVSGVQTVARASLDKKNFRAELAEQVKLDLDTTKELLAILIFNPSIVAHESTAIWTMLEDNGYEPRHFFRLASKSSILKSLVPELKYMWEVIMTDWEKTTGKDRKDEFKSKGEVDKETGEYIKLPRYKATKFRAFLYFKMERQIMDVVRKFMSGKICHLMHDGFFTPEKVDIEKLRIQIKQETGFDMKISGEIL